MEQDSTRVGKRPQLFGRLAALIGRLTQSTLDDDRSRLHIYLDDPIIAMRGDKAAVEKEVTLAVLVWRCMNVDLAFLKGQFGTAVTWVGHDVSINMKELAITAAIKRAFLEDLLTEALAIDKNNKIKRKELRSFTGKSNHVASLIWTWKPFLDELWAAADSTHRSNAGKRPDLDKASDGVTEVVGALPHSPGRRDFKDMECSKPSCGSHLGGDSLRCIPLGIGRGALHQQRPLPLHLRQDNAAR